MPKSEKIEYASELQSEIAQILRRRKKGATIAQIAQVVGRPHGAVSRAVYAMYKDCLVKGSLGRAVNSVWTLN